MLIAASKVIKYLELQTATAAEKKWKNTVDSRRSPAKLGANLTKVWVADS